MGKTEKKFGKGRLDHYYRLAKEKGYRARSSFKILQLNEKYNFFGAAKGAKPRPMCVIDLCAAPGSWCQVATQKCPVNSLIVGVDLDPIKPLPNVISFQSDITTDHCRSQLRGYLKTWKADVVMHDGAPNVGMAWAQDAFTQSELVLQSLKLAVEFLRPGGWFVTKVFRSKDYNKLMWVFQQFFERCEATKPPSSRNVSAEIFVVCRNFKAPKDIDPRLLDTHYVFSDLDEKATAGQMQAKIFNPEKKKRQRDGYDVEDQTLLLTNEQPVMEFINAEDPVAFLGATTVIKYDKNSDEAKQLKSLPLTTHDLLECFKDLRVLGKKDFRTMLRWRMAARKVLGIDKPEEEAEEEKVELTTEEQIEKEMEELADNEKTRKKRERRKRNEEKQKAIVRMQLGMDTPHEIGVEAAENNDLGSLFNIKSAKREGDLIKLVKGKQKVPTGVELGPEKEFDLGDAEITQADLPEESDSDEESKYVEVDEDDVEALEDQLNHMYKKFQSERLKNADAETRARKEREREPWYGIEDGPVGSDIDSDDDEMVDDAPVSSAARVFFDKPIFNDIEQVADSDSADTDASDDEAEEVSAKGDKGANGSAGSGAGAGAAASDEDVDMEESEDEAFDPTKKEDGQNASIKMTLAHKLLTGQINKHDLINEGYNKTSFRDTDGLPEWFLEDEREHSKLIKPITKEAAAALKEQLKALNARPIKKVQEAMGRKKMRAHKRLESIRKKSELINEDTGKSEREKSEDIAKLFRNTSKVQKQRPKVTVVAARGQNRRLQGRPRGVKGKYKMVDGVSKKEGRALKRIAKKKK